MRYQISMDCGYWHEAAVVDTVNVWSSGCPMTVAECCEIEDAKKIALALNRLEMLESGGETSAEQSV